jgi:hypothetical protein
MAYETNWISENGNPTLSTSVVVPKGLPRAIPVSAMPKSIQKDKTKHMLTQNLHPASSTQQAEQAGFTHEQIPKRASQFFLKINKRQSS